MIASIILYIDPGTGGLLISAIISIALTLLFSLKGFFYKIKFFLYRTGRKDISNFTGKLLFFSEGKSYWRVYKPVIEELIKSKHSLVYISADKEDKGLSISSNFVESHYLGNIKQAIFVLNSLKAKMCVMTTPQLNVIALKRSKGVEHYCHIIHSPTDIHAYKKFAFDYFDSVLCSSESQMVNLRQLEKDRNSNQKQIFETGCTYYDVFESDLKNNGDAILLAPTWGERTFFKSCGIDIINHLLNGGHRVIFRPHPQSWISDKDLIDKVILTFGSNTNFIVDKDVGGEQSISESMLLICDITSGMLFDMAFVYKKPVVAIKFDWDNGGYEASDITKETAAIDLLKDVGDIMHAYDVKDICKVVNEASKKTITQQIINKHIFNFQEAGKVAAEQILSIYKSQKNGIR